MYVMQADMSTIPTFLGKLLNFTDSEMQYIGVFLSEVCFLHEVAEVKSEKQWGQLYTVPRIR